MHRTHRHCAQRAAQALLACALGLGASLALADGLVGPLPNKAPTIAKGLQQAKTYTVTSPLPDSLALSKPGLPDLGGYTAAAVEAKIDRHKRGMLSVRRMMQQDVLKEFVGGNNKMAEWVKRQRGIPSALFLDHGYMSLQEMAKAEPAYFSEPEPGVYVARLPIVVARHGILEINGKTRELRLSQDRGAFIINDGKLFITDTRVTGWNEEKNAPSTFEEPKTFRPFIISWGGTETYFVNATMASLGYNQSKSYGISISQYTPNMKLLMKRSEPTGWIIGSRFSDMWYGFYCYETNDFVLKGNVYSDNVIYGIDPHDRSKRLIITDNDVYGTHKKHGIIISREVNDSFIFNNRVHDNNLSGVVIDRNSVNNLVADNDIFRNHTDGITLYESADNLIWGNHVVANKRHGIRIRNSVNIRLYENASIGNGLTGVYGHIKDLSATDRDIKLDPFDTEVSMIVVGGQLLGNGSAPLAIDSPLSVELYQVKMLAPTKTTGITFNGVLGDNQYRIFDLLNRQRAVLIDPVERQTAARD
ncbi:mannuronan 5-epimerase AlgG [Pseudomonas sp. HR96]|uniref:mannuronan 5-epimerase AlgG n=1 Tax=Pseudomonas sp. HR96 TaxID=1027966 RepID=UPI002A74CAB1|nr:mannuronan 5-epimerase AlgG [Pseudomonas sp. HR96]WPP00742.1 mannuronan 5-epimerase AlgG [Pseudomonas sp. HR96]